MGSIPRAAATVFITTNPTSPQRVILLNGVLAIQAIDDDGQPIEILIHESMFPTFRGLLA